MPNLINLSKKNQNYQKLLLIQILEIMLKDYPHLAHDPNASNNPPLGLTDAATYQAIVSGINSKNITPELLGTLNNIDGAQGTYMGKLYQYFGVSDVNEFTHIFSVLMGDFNTEDNYLDDQGLLTEAGIKLVTDNLPGIINAKKKSLDERKVERAAKTQPAQPHSKPVTQPQPWVVTPRQQPTQPQPTPVTQPQQTVPQQTVIPPVGSGTISVNPLSVKPATSKTDPSLTGAAPKTQAQRKVEVKFSTFIKNSTHPIYADIETESNTGAERASAVYTNSNPPDDLALIELAKSVVYSALALGQTGKLVIEGDNPALVAAAIKVCIASNIQYTSSVSVTLEENNRNQYQIEEAFLNNLNIPQNIQEKLKSCPEGAPPDLKKVPPPTSPRI